MSDETPGKSNIAPEAAARLVDRLIEDPDFRTLFQSDARKALAEIGHDVEGLSDCCDFTQLASVDELRAVQKQLAQYLSTSSQAMTVVFCFEAGKVAGVLK